MYRNLESCCRSIIFKNKQTHTERDRICGYHRQKVGGEGLGGQKIQTSSYQISITDVMYNITLINTAVCYIWKLLVNPEFSSQGKNYFFNFVSVWDEGHLLNL